MLEYIVTNFPLFCVCLAMGITAITTFRSNKKASTDVLVILGLCISLSVTVYFDIYASKQVETNVLATWMTYLGYVLRIVTIYFFVRMADKTNTIPNWVFLILVGVNAVLYMPALFLNSNGFNEIAYKFVPNEAGTGLVMDRGPLNFTSHIIGILFILYLIFISFKMITLKHKDDGIVVLICAAFVISAVILEAFQLATNLLNLIIAISCIFYYLFLNRDKNRRDVLTNLFSRKTYYEDVNKNFSKVAGVILFDMNGLKEINDNKGHEEGDKALKAISSAILSSLLKDMSAYRMGGDEFLVLSVFSKEKELLNVGQLVQDKVEKAGYSVSYGIAYHTDKEDVDTLVKRAEEEMYKDKAHFYETHKIERRKR